MNVDLALLAKAPIPGTVKTRMLPALSALGANELHKMLVEHAVHQACQSQVHSVTLFVSQHHGFFTELQFKRHFQIALQTQAGLGARIHQALIASGNPTLLMGCDCPPITTELINACALSLQYTGFVFLPAEDGGFGLIGVQDPSTLPPPAVLEQIHWGSGRVMQEMRDLLRRYGFRWEEIKTIWDVDRPEDLEKLKGLWGGELLF